VFNKNQLPNDIQELKTLFIETLEAKENFRIENKDLRIEIERLMELVRFFKRREFASNSEMVSSEQLGIFNELEEIINPADKDGTIDVKGHKKKGRKPLPENLPREKIIIDLDESEKECVSCGTQLKQIGEETSEQLEIIPAQFKVIKTIRKKYACPNNNCDEGIKTPPCPLVALPKSIASASLLAYLIVSKYCDHLPLYRLSNILNRFGVEISRGSMASWMIKLSELLLPLCNLLHERLLEGSYLAMDETRVQVLKEPGKT